MPDYELMPAERRAEFDGLVASGAHPEFLQTWGWGELKASTGWRPHRLVVRGAAGRVLGACSVLERGLPGLGPLLYAPRGPIVDWGDAEAAGAVLRALLAFGRARRAVAVKLDPGVPAALAAPLLQAHGFRLLQAGLSFEGVQPRFHMQLPLLGRGEDQLLAAMHSKTRYNIRLAARRGVTVREGLEADLPAFYEVLLETARRDRFLVRGRAYFEAMWRECLGRGLGWLLLGEAEGRLLAGAIVFRLGPLAWYLYGASANRERERMAAHAVQWAAIQRSRAAGCAIYDFRGVSGDLRPEHPLYGLYRFKQGFGAQLVEWVGEWDRPLRPLPYLAAQRALPLARHLLAALRRRAAAAPAE